MMPIVSRPPIAAKMKKTPSPKMPQLSLILFLISQRQLQAYLLVVSYRYSHLQISQATSVVFLPFSRFRCTTVFSHETRHSSWTYLTVPVHRQGAIRPYSCLRVSQTSERQILQDGRARGGSSLVFSYLNDRRIQFQLIVWLAVVESSASYCILQFLKLIIIIHIRTAMEPGIVQQPESKIQEEAVPVAARKGSAEVIRKQEDTKSVFVQSVDYGATNQELEAIFEDCGTIVRVTILKQKTTNRPKGCAYVEFADAESVAHAIMLSGLKLRNRAIKVSQKRTNIRGMTNSKAANELLFSKLLNSLGPRGRGM